MPDPLLEIRNVSQFFRGAGGQNVEILRNINLEIREREIVAILGPSGCGKSTLLRTLIGLEPTGSGQILYRGKVQTGLNPSTSLVFQNFALFPWLTVQQNVAVGLATQPLTEAVRAERIRQVIATVGLAGSEEAYPKELSGGMKQRVGLARALAVQPELLCMDEPFSALDVLTSETLRNEVIDLFISKTSPVNTIVLVTHSIGEAAFMATRLVVMGAHPGTVRAIIDHPQPFPRDEHHPEFLALTEKVHALITQNLLPTTVAGVSGAAPGRLPVQSIPIISLSSAAGLLEVLKNEGGGELFDLAQRVPLELTQLLLVVKAAELLGWITTPDGRVKMTPEGRRFLAADIHQRQQQLNTRLKGLFVFDEVLRMLRESPHHEIDEAVVLSHFALLFPREQPLRLFRAVVGWARYAGLFKYSSSRRILYLVPAGVPAPAASA